MSQARKACEQASNSPFVKALAIFDTAAPSAAAYSSGSSETRAQCTLGTTNVCPALSGRISALTACVSLVRRAPECAAEHLEMLRRDRSHRVYMLEQSVL